jgi:hypothetical protein
MQTSKFCGSGKNYYANSTRLRNKCFKKIWSRSTRVKKKVGETPALTPLLEILMHGLSLTILRGEPPVANAGAGTVAWDCRTTAMMQTDKLTSNGTQDTFKGIVTPKFDSLYVVSFRSLEESFFRPFSISCRIFAVNHNTVNESGYGIDGSS